MPQLFHELTERDKCSYSLTVHGLPESMASLTNTRIADDLKSLSDTAQLLTLSLPPNVKLLRLGGGGSNKARPLKVIFPSKELALLISSMLVSVMLELILFLLLLFVIVLYWKENIYAVFILNLRNVKRTVNPILWTNTGMEYLLLLQLLIGLFPRLMLPHLMS